MVPFKTLSNIPTLVICLSSSKCAFSQLIYKLGVMKHSFKTVHNTYKPRKSHNKHGNYILAPHMGCLDTHISLGCIYEI